MQRKRKGVYKMDYTLTLFLINFLGLAILCMGIWITKQLFLLIRIVVRYYRAMEKEMDTAE